MALLSLDVNVPNVSKIAARLIAWQQESPVEPLWAAVYGSNIEITCYAVTLLRCLNIKVPLRDEIVELITSRQLSDGGFADTKDQVSTLHNTFLAITVPMQLDHPIPNREKVANFISALQNPDGGFAPVADTESDLRHSTLFHHFIGWEPNRDTIENASSGFYVRASTVSNSLEIGSKGAR